MITIASPAETGVLERLRWTVISIGILDSLFYDQIDVKLGTYALSECRKRFIPHNGVLHQYLAHRLRTTHNIAYTKTRSESICIGTKRKYNFTANDRRWNTLWCVRDGIQASDNCNRRRQRRKRKPNDLGTAWKLDAERNEEIRAASF